MVAVRTPLVRAAALPVTLGMIYVIWLMASADIEIEPGDFHDGTSRHVYTDEGRELNTTGIERLPGAICIGSKKSGTTLLARFLALNQNIKVSWGEVHFFDQEQRYRRGFKLYQNHIQDIGENEVAMEKTPKYFVYEPAAARIHAMNSSIKLLLILRDPVKRLISDYDHEMSLPDRKYISPNAEEMKYFRRIEKDYSFEELVFSADGELNKTYEPVIVSMYDIHVERYLALFPREQLLVLDGEQFSKYPLPILRQCETFLGVPHLIRDDMFLFNKEKGYYCLSTEPCTEGRGVPHEAQPDDVMRKLHALYTPHVRRLVALLGQEFLWSTNYL